MTEIFEHFMNTNTLPLKGLAHCNLYWIWITPFPKNIPKINLSHLFYKDCVSFKFILQRIFWFAPKYILCVQVKVTAHLLLLLSIFYMIFNACLIFLFILNMNNTFQHLTKNIIKRMKTIILNPLKEHYYAYSNKLFSGITYEII